MCQIVHPIAISSSVKKPSYSSYGTSNHSNINSNQRIKIQFFGKIQIYGHKLQSISQKLFNQTYSQKMKLKLH